MNQRLGCLTNSGILAAILTLVIVAGVVLAQGGAIFSPGPLNAQAGGLLGEVHSHAEIGNRCATCHPAFWQTVTMADRCTACHTDIPAQLSGTDNLHGVLLQNDTGMACWKCHPEHNGPDAPLTVLKDVDFLHDSFGYSLLAHSPRTGGRTLDCRDCHANDFINFKTAVCESCHLKENATFIADHLLLFGKDCLACHDGLDTYGKDFKHAKVSFPLTGKHIEIQCIQCHLAARTILDLKATSSNCSDCHKQDDPHESRFGQDCAACHTLDGWKPAIFDHNLASFKLEGKHLKVDCNSCHTNGILGVTPTTCIACHQNDNPHPGRFGTDCAACHTPGGWKPANFNHNLAAFKLQGKHLEVKCSGCHTNGILGVTPNTCIACHQDDDQHLGRFGTDCASCHTPIGWKPANFNHSLVSFNLEGKHAQAACYDCHLNGLFKGTPIACAACHQKDDFHQGRFGTDCATCHSPAGWKPATFDHNLSVFQLTGAHANVACVNCHINGVFHGTPTNCGACHIKNDAHNGRFGSGCGQCHTTAGWLPATFDHSISAFPLTGTHIGLACTRCHGGGQYAGLSAVCVACHADPPYHFGLLGTKCAACHTTTAWHPAQFNGIHTFPMGHQGGAACSTCHPLSLTVYTCYGCHEHNADQISKTHFEKGISNFTDCIQCHPTGRKE